MKKSRSKSKLIIHLVLIIGVVMMVIPFIWMILTSFKTSGEAVKIPPTILPKHFSFKNYKDVLAKLPFLSFYKNTLLLMVGRVICVLITSTTAAYAFAKIKFPFRNFLFAVVLLEMMVPSQIFITPQFLLAQKLGILDSIPGLILPGIVSAFGTFLLRQFFMGLPDELGEAATIDGCNTWQVFYKVYLPLAKSGIIALGIFTSLWAFKDLMWPLIVNATEDKMPLSAGIVALQGRFVSNYPQIMAGSLLAIWPMLIIFIIFQKNFIKGVASTGGKL